MEFKSLFRTGEDFKKAFVNRGCIGCTLPRRGIPEKLKFTLLERHMISLNVTCCIEIKSRKVSVLSLILFLLGIGDVLQAALSGTDGLFLTLCKKKTMFPTRSLCHKRLLKLHRLENHSYAEIMGRLSVCLSGCPSAVTFEVRPKCLCGLLSLTSNTSAFSLL